MIKTEDLQAFIAVSESESFSKASKATEIQIATLSRAITRLEKQLNATLFNRTTRKLVITEEGMVFKRYALEAIEAIEQGQQQLCSHQNEPIGKLRVDSAFPFMIHQIVPHIAEFHLLYPMIELELSTNEDVVDLLDNKVDVAIRIGDLKDSTLYAFHLGYSPLMLVASPEYIEQFGKPKVIDDLAAHKLLGFSRAPHLNDWHLKQQMGRLTFDLQASSGEVMKQLCLNGLGISALSYFMIYKELEAGTLVEILPDAIAHPNRRESIQAVYYKQSALASRIRLFLEFIQDKLVLNAE